jgi:hypothetical protein
MQRLAAWFLPLAAVAIVLTVIFGDLPGQGRYIAVLQDSCHTPAFAALGVLTLLWLRKKPDIAIAIAVVIGLTLLGGATEIIQGFIGRDSELDDVARDFVGATVAASLWLTVRWPDRRRYLAGLLVLGLVGLWLTPLVQCGLAYLQRARDFPVLAQFRGHRDLYFIQYTGGRLESQALSVSLAEGEWPGVTLIEPKPDWRGFRTLSLDLSNPAATALLMSLRIHDRSHNFATDDRFNTQLQLAPGARVTFDIPLDQVAASPRTRKMDMAHISQLTLFHHGAAPGYEVMVHRVWLR